MSILDEIISAKKSEVSKKTQKLSLKELKSLVNKVPVDRRGFAAKLRNKNAVSPQVIAELKRQSPSKGVLRADFNVRELAAELEKSGASALSVLTDEKYFGGSVTNLEIARNAVNLPVLRKDFLIDEYQIYESALIGADAVLLVADLLRGTELKNFIGLATELGLDVLIETHDEEGLNKILEIGPNPETTLIGINNRDLKTFKVDTESVIKLSGKIPKDYTLVSESGIQGPDDIRKLAGKGIHIFLIGEYLMKSSKPGEALKELLRR